MACGRRDAGSKTVVEVVVVIFAVAEVRVRVFIPGSCHDASIRSVVDDEAVGVGGEPRPQGFFEFEAVLPRELLVVDLFRRQCDRR